MPLRHIKVLEFAGYAPGPFAGLILKDFGAEVIRVDQLKTSIFSDVCTRGKKSIKLNLKNDEGRKIVEKLIGKSDVLIEPFRPGVMEKLKLGPLEACRLNKRLIYARLSGYGQTGPLSSSAGHDINFIAVSGLLSLFRELESSKPIPPLNLLGDFCGGGLMCVLGICIGLIERNKSGLGQVIDSNIVEGINYLSSWIYLTRQNTPILWPNVNKRCSNLLDGGYPFYDTYVTKDKKYMALAPLEPKFFQNFIKILKIEADPALFMTSDLSVKEMKAKLAAIFKTKTQKEWVEVFSGQDVCVTPVVDIDDAPLYEHHKARNSFLKDGSPRPSPILSRTPAQPKIESTQDELHTRNILQDLGYSDLKIKELLEKNVISEKI